jgi:hypothetical protein
MKGFDLGTPFVLFQRNSPAFKSGEWGIIVYGRGNDYSYTCNPHYIEIHPCF